jgi:thioredoxin reductase
VLVVGGGRAGLLAAIGAAGAGGRVVLIEAEPALGGGWRVEGAFDSGWEAGTERAAGTVAELAARAAGAGVEIRCGVAAVGWYDGMVGAIGDDALFEIRAGAVVAATGSYERVPLVPGADRPGVIAARTVTALIERFGILPGGHALLVGAGQELEDAGVRLRRAGAASVAGPVATGSLVSVRGRDRVTGAVTRQGRRVVRHRVDLLVFGDRSPSLDLVLAAGAAVEMRGGTLSPVCDEWGRTTVPSLFVAGSAAGLPMADAAGAEAARAARLGAMVCFCEDVRAWEIRSEQDAGYGDPELLKRRTGALTGPCQGKYCLQAFAGLAGAPPDGAVAIPTGRPPLRPVRLGDLVGAGDDGEGAAVRLEAP